MLAAFGLFCTPEELQRQWQDGRRWIVPADPAIAFQIPSAHDPDLAPPGKHAAAAFSLWVPIESGQADYARLKAEMGQRVIVLFFRLVFFFVGLFFLLLLFFSRFL